jgi:E3 ubiquitin-protein ligase TRIP12
MSRRVTRSSARNTAAPSTNPAIPDPPAQPTTAATSSLRKRKASAQEPVSESNEVSTDILSKKRAKKTKTETPVPLPLPEAPTFRTRGRPAADMPDSREQTPSVDEENSNTPAVSASSSKRKSSKKKGGEASAGDASSSTPAPPKDSRKSSSRSKRGEKEEIPTQKPVEEDPDNSDSDEEGENRAPPDDEDEDMDDDEDMSRPWGKSGGSRLEAAMQRIHGAIARTMTDLRSILENLRQRDDQTLQRLALEELAHLLLMANEDTLAGHFSPDPYVRELVPLMQPNEFGEENPEMMLMACRCLANMIEALPSSTASIVYGGAVPILCQKLLEIHYIDLAEQALSTLEKISVEFPAAIVREGGLTACLTYLDFFATSTQRTAVTTAANCCRNIQQDSFATVRDVMPTLLQVLNSSDQKVLEQGCLCVSRIVESFRHQESKLEELMSEDFLKAILRLLVPGTTNLIGPKIHTSFLRVLAFTARASPKRSVALIKMNVVDTLYQILTGISPPSGSDDMAGKIDKVMIMQALIHRPRDQIFETLNVICELLPNISIDGLHYLEGLFDAGFPGHEHVSIAQQSSQAGDENRGALLKDCQQELRRFTVILFPTLTDAYSSTVNLSVRQKVLTAQLKMLSNIGVAILEDSLRSVSYSSFLATILSQGDETSLATFALQAAEVLLKRMEHIYRYQFYREGVFAEIRKLAARELIAPIPVPPPIAENGASTSSTAVLPISILPAQPLATETTVHSQDSESGANDTIGDMDMEFHDGPDEDDEDQDDDENEDGEDDDDEDEDDEDGEEHAGDEEIDEMDQEHESDDSDSDENSDDYVAHAPPSAPNTKDLITIRAKKFMELYDSDEGSALRLQASNTLKELQDLTQKISQCFTTKSKTDGLHLFTELATYFNQDALSSVTSYELLSSKIVDTLLDIISEPNPRIANARALFLQAFMGQGTQTKEVTANSASPATPFSIFVHKLQDLLSREEHFEVMTAHQNSAESGRNSSASILAKQVRLRLIADPESGFPESFSQTMVTVHALATIKSLADFLRPRLSLPERSSRYRRDGMPAALAAYAEAFASRRAGTGGIPPIPLPSDLTNRTIPKRGERSEKPRPSKAGNTPGVLPAPPIDSPATPLQPSTPSTPAASSSLRRSRRNNGPPIPPPPPIANTEGDPVECADEKQISDGDDVSERNATLSAIVDGLGDAMDTDEDDPSAVNLEVAATGKVTARKEDGTRIATPVSSQKVSRSVSTPRPSGSASRHHHHHHSTPSRALSYAAAMASTPQDWHLEFSVDGQPISQDTTIYRVVHFNQRNANEISARNLLQATHTIHFKRVPGPPPTESTSLSLSTYVPRAIEGGLPDSLSHNLTTASILRLLSLLHGLNSNIEDVLADNKDASRLIAEPLSQFVNTKLTAKLNRQLEEPLIVASGCLPSWSEDLARLYPFLFPFETRHLFLQSTSFGFARSMTRWQNDQSSNDSRTGRLRDDRHFLGRLQRQKVRISRAKMLESGVKVMELYGSSASILEVEFFDEVGTGLGPTLEFYSTVSRDFAKKKLGLWRVNDTVDESEFAFGSRGLFPAPMNQELADSENGKKVLSLFKSLGKFVARSMLDSRIIDISFNATFFRVGSSAAAVTPSLGAVESVDESLARSLRPLKKAASLKTRIEEDDSLTNEQKEEQINAITIDGIAIDDLSLDFTLPGHPEIELKPNGSEESVTVHNIGAYVENVMDYTLGVGVRRQVDAFHEGFSLVFPYAALQAFTPDELVMLFGRVDEDWSLESKFAFPRIMVTSNSPLALMDAVKADHGYNLDSKSVRNLLQIMSSLSPQERREFLQFVTGSPKLPIGGMYWSTYNMAQANFTKDLNLSLPCSRLCASPVRLHTLPMTICPRS